ncbi:Periplasmic dipeptide transport protein precursor [Vibrio aerogenes CECT 7868]|uniref:Periplasmic dipeptide transport protein n=2 Tax=Vibrio aerogenes TaxID=92172 RepID=A0A1M5YRD3_9VIBR|nr:ABC transporter substrate-binding protein [Vibrio aerogenes]SHI14418.1 Periplasmic dipeptide transport protein precursor [Vibrio aerogenes CECT 7868]
MWRWMAVCICILFAESGIAGQAITGSGPDGVQLKIAMDAELVSLDPHEQLSESALQYSHMVFDPLVRWRQDGSFEPRLATRWQWMNATTLRVFLRHGVFFHTGNPFRADDVAFTIHRLQQSSDFKALFRDISHVSVVDPLTIDIFTYHPSPLLLHVLTYVFTIDQRFYQGQDEIIKYGRSFASVHASGTGPYKLQERVRGEKMVFVRNPDYWDKDSPGNVQRIEIVPVTSDSTRLAALLTGDADVITPVASVDVQRVNRLPEIQLISLPGTRIIMLQLNQQHRAELRDVRVRKAINLAINQRLIVKKILRGLGQPAGQLSAEQFAGHVDELLPGYDLQKARQLMKQAGYEQGFRLSMIAPNNRYMNDEQVAQAVVAMLRQIHIQVDLKTLPKAQYFQLYDQQTADIMMVGWQSDTLDSNNIYEFMVACRNGRTGLGTYNVTGYCNPEVDKQIQAAGKEMDREKRTLILQNIEQILAKDVPVVPLHWQRILWAVRKGVELQDVLNVQNYPYLGDLVVHAQDQPNQVSGGVVK